MSPEPVVLFQLGPRLFAARAAGVNRIGSPREEGIPVLLAASCLGRPWAPVRSLVVLESGRESGLCVDQVLGFRLVDDADVVPLPPLAAGTLATESVAGLVLLDGVPTPLVDLPTLMREEGSSAAPERSPDA